MKVKSLTVLALAVGVLLVTVPLLAHHGNSAFDTGKRLTLKGTVTEWFWANPHCFLKFDVKDDSGAVVNWVAETTNGPDMMERGWSKQSFKAGDEVTVTVRPVKSGRPVGSIIQVQFADGHVLSAVGGGGNEPTPARP